MKKVYIQNLAFTVTNMCNLDCKHCLRGTKSSDYISFDVIEKTLDQVQGIGNVAINGGEPTLAIKEIEKIITYIVDNNICIDEVTTTINGTNYSEEFLKLLDYAEDYIGEEKTAIFTISADNYHIDELKRLGFFDSVGKNAHLYKQNKHFYGFRDINKKLFREGNACNLDEELTVPLRPMKTFITYVGKNRKYDRENGLCNIGPLVTIATDGTITECDASIENQKTLYNYGNILNDSIEEVILKNGILIEKPKKFEKLANKELSRYWSYNK